MSVSIQERATATRSTCSHVHARISSARQTNAKPTVHPSIVGDIDLNGCPSPWALLPKGNQTLRDFNPFVKPRPPPSSGPPLSTPDTICYPLDYAGSVSEHRQLR